MLGDGFLHAASEGASFYMLFEIRNLQKSVSDVLLLLKEIQPVEEVVFEQLPLFSKYLKALLWGLCEIEILHFLVDVFAEWNATVFETPGAMSLKFTKNFL